MQFEPLLTFLVAGFVVQNMTNQGGKLLDAIEKTGSVVYVVFFATAGANLDIPLLRSLWPVALALAATRGVATWFAGRMSGDAANDPAVLRQLGVVQPRVAGGADARDRRRSWSGSSPRLGSPFQALVIATVALNQVAGPILFKLALDRAGETSKVAEPAIEAGVEA